MKILALVLAMAFAAPLMAHAAPSTSPGFNASVAQTTASQQAEAGGGSR
jgi:hypothetical protein